MEEEGIQEHMEAAAEIAVEAPVREESSCSKADFYYMFALFGVVISAILFGVSVYFLASQSHVVVFAVVLVFSMFSMAGSIYKSVELSGKGRNPRAVRPFDVAPRLEQGDPTGMRMTVRSLRSGEASKSNISIASGSAQPPVEAGSSGLQSPGSSTFSERTSCTVECVEEASESRSPQSIRRAQASEESTETSGVSEMASSTSLFVSEKVEQAEAQRTEEAASEKQSGASDTLPQETVEQKDLIRHRKVPLESTSEQRIPSSDEKVEEA